MENLKSYILTYNEDIKNKIVENSIASKDQVSVIGMIRADAYFHKFVGKKYYISFITTSSESK